MFGFNFFKGEEPKNNQEEVNKVVVDYSDSLEAIEIPKKYASLYNFAYLASVGNFEDAKEVRKNIEDEMGDEYAQYKEVIDGIIEALVSSGSIQEEVLKLPQDVVDALEKKST